MKKRLLALAAAVLALGAGAETVEYDFTKPDVLTKNAPLKMRGKAVLDSNGLKTIGGVVTPDAAYGIKQVSSHLDSFTVTADFTLEPMKKEVIRYIFDSKYISLPGTDPKRAQYHKGMMLGVRKFGKYFRPYLAIGFGSKSVEFYGGDMTLAYGKKYTLEMDFTGKGQVTFFLNGKRVSRHAVPAGAMAASSQWKCFANRAGSSYYPLNGTLHKVVFADLKDRSIKPGTVLASWDFSKPETLGDLTVRGKSTKIADGALQVLTEGDLAQTGGAQAKTIDPMHTPENAFDIEAVIALSSTYKRKGNNQAAIFDSKYVARPDNSPKSLPRHTGFMFYLQPRGGDNYRMGAAFGYGKSSAEATSKEFKLEKDKDYTVKMHFSASGKVVFYLDGKEVSAVSVPAGALAPATLAAVLGDRIGSNYYPFGGSIKKVEIKSAEYTPVSISPSAMHRKVFERGEKPELHAEILNASLNDLKNITIEAKLGDMALAKKKIDLISAGSSVAFSYELSPWLLEKTYPVAITARNEKGGVVATGSYKLTIVPAPSQEMMVLLWGGYASKVVKDVGFTHQSMNIFPIRGFASEKSRPALIEQLDDMLAQGLYAYTSVYAKYRFLQGKRYLRTNRQGKPYGRENLEASNPAARAEYAAAAESIAKVIGDHPGWGGTLLNSEVRDSSNPSFGGVEPENFKKYAGFDIPKHVNSKYPVSHRSAPNFPWNRIVKDDLPELVFYRWFWREGDGWNPMQTLLSETLHKNINRKNFFTFYDPVVRVPPLWGSGGKVDMVSQWTYAYPDPIKIAQATDEVSAMADGNPGQKIASMTQIICYRSQVAPMNIKVDNPPEWISREGQARFVTIPPDIFREALWSKISRRLDGIMYHGSSSLFAPANHSYRYTNSETKVAFKEAMHRIVKPLGPILQTIPEYTPEIAILESYNASLYSPGLFAQGWSNKWAGDLHIALQWAHLQPKIYFEEHFMNNKVEKLPQVLFVPGAEVLTDKVLKMLQDLQKKGVIIVGDEYTTPALMVDLRIKSVIRRSADPVNSKKELQALGRQIRAMLADIYTSPMRASNQDIVLYRRGLKNADYVFAVNDKRTFGNYLGQWGRIMEKGLANSGTVTINHSSKAAYDLVAHKAIPFQSTGNTTTYNVELAPGDGALVLLLDQVIGKVKVTQTMAVRSQPYTLTIQVLDTTGKPVKAILPLEVKMADSAGNTLPRSGFYATDANGKLVIEDTAAVNMAAGKVTTTVRNLADGKVYTVANQVK